MKKQIEGDNVIMEEDFPSKRKKLNQQYDYCQMVEYFNQLYLFVKILDSIESGNDHSIFDKKIISNILQKADTEHNTIEVIQYKPTNLDIIISNTLLPILFLSDKSGNDQFNDPLICFFTQKIVFKLWSLDSKRHDLLHILCDIFQIGKIRNEECIILIRNIVKYLRKSHSNFESNTLFELVTIITDRVVTQYSEKSTELFPLLFAANDMVYNFIKLVAIQKERHDLPEITSRIFSYCSSILMLDYSSVHMDVNSKKLFSIMRKVVEISHHNFMDQFTCIVDKYLPHFGSELTETNFCSDCVEPSVQRECLLLMVKLVEKCNNDSSKQIWNKIDKMNILSQSVEAFYSTIHRVCSAHDVSLLKVFLSLFQIHSNWSQSNHQAIIDDDKLLNSRVSSFMQVVLNPLQLIYNLFKVMNFNVGILMDYLISDETCEYILELIFKICRWLSSVPSVLHSQVEEEYISTITSILSDLHSEIYHLHSKSLFPYDASVLLKRLKVFSEY